jgi:hypothetical protein
MARVVPVYQCFFFAAGRIDCWENIESDSDAAIEVLLSQRLAAGNWEAAEAWAQDLPDRGPCRSHRVSHIRRVKSSMISSVLPSAAAPA